MYEALGDIIAFPIQVIVHDVKKSEQGGVGWEFHPGTSGKTPGLYSSI